MKEMREELLWRLRAMGIATPQIAKELQKVEKVMAPSLITAFYWEETPQGLGYWANLQKRYMVAKRELKEPGIVKLLRGYCHHPKCRHVNDCPTRHPKCKERLGLDTAIAWKAIYKLRGGDKNCLYALKDILEYHWEKYQRLIWIIRLAIDHLEGL